MTRITNPPNDAANYTRSQTYGTRERTKSDLKLCIEQHAPRIVVICSFGLISELEPQILEHGYSVSFLPIEDSENFAEFYLKKA